MSTMISKDDIFLITEIMKSRPGEGIDGYIDRATGEVLTDSPLEAEFDPQYYLPIPQEGSGNGYQDMVDFIETVQNERLRDLLEVAVQGRGAFRRFKDVLLRSEYESESNHWFAFSEKREYDRTVEWLVSQGFIVET